MGANQKRPGNQKYIDWGEGGLGDDARVGHFVSSFLVILKSASLEMCINVRFVILGNK